MIKRSLFSRLLAGMVLLALTLLISACGSGGGGGGSSTGGAGSTKVVSSNFAGSVGDGPIVGATVSVYDRNGTLLQTAVSDSYAYYSTSVQAEENAYPLIIEVNDGTDLVTGREPDFKLSSVVLYPAATNVNINPYTTFMVEIARNMPGGITAANISSARVIVMDKLNFGLDPAFIADPLSTQITDQNVAVMVKASEALGEMIRRTRDQLMAIGVVAAGDDVVDAIASDLVDGVLDGRGGSQASNRVAAVTQLTSAQVTIEAMSNNLKVDGSVATGSMDAAIIATRPLVPLSLLTNSVPVNQEQLVQARETIKVAQILSPSGELDSIATTLDSLSAGSTASAVEAVLPIGTSAALDQPVAVAVAANDEELEAAVNVDSNDIPTDPPVENTAPVLSGTPATSATEDSLYSFTPSAFDPDGDTLSFSINTKPSWANFSPSTGKLSGTPRNGDTGANGIVISVTDGAKTASLPSFNITVKNTNDAPTISGTPPTSATEDSNYSFTPSYNDPDGDTLSFSINTKPSWANFSPSTGKLSGTPRNGDTGANGIVISVTDGAKTASLPSFNITVINTNDAPTISGTPPTSATEDSNYSFTPSYNDPDGDTLSFSINTKPSWANFSPSTGKLSGTPRNGDTGANGIVISVTDGAKTASLPSFNITVKNTNDAPTISGTPPTSATEDSNYSFTPSYNDPDGDTLSFSINTKPSWANFSPSTGKLSGTPRNGDTGANGIVISVTDGAKTASLPSFNITVINTNDAPTISGTPPTSATEDSNYSFTPSYNDPDGDTLSFSINTKPSWANFSSSTGKLSGTPRNGDTGANGIVISVTDGAKTAWLPSFNITVINTNDAPTISGTPPTSVTEDSNYSFTPSYNDPDGDTLSFSINTKPSWANFSPSTGKLSGTPRNGDTGANGIVISVTDGAKTASLPSFNITVINTNDAPTISGTPPTSATEDSNYSFTPSYNDPDGDTLSFSINTKPSWANFSPSTGKLSGTPRNGDTGANGIVISVTDGAKTAWLPSFNITVINTNDAPTISGTPPTSVTEDSNYSFTPSYNDPDGDTLSFSINTKPSWANFSPSTGKLSGTPRNGDTGANGIVISVTDGAKTASLPSFNITVDPAPALTGNFSVSWTAPVARADGEALSLSAISGYRIYIGNSSGTYPDFADVNDKSATSWTVTNVPVGTSYVVMTTIDVDGRESENSQEVAKIVQ